jgi:hypothetical protein
MPCATAAPSAASQIPGDQRRELRTTKLCRFVEGSDKNRFQQAVTQREIVDTRGHEIFGSGQFVFARRPVDDGRGYPFGRNFSV